MPRGHLQLTQAGAPVTQDHLQPTQVVPPVPKGYLRPTQVGATSWSFAFFGGPVAFL